MSSKVKKHRQWTNADLVFEYEQLNRRFFDKKVRAKVRFANLKPGLLGRTAPKEDGQFLIEINEKFKEFCGVARTTLIHEMAHVELDLEGYVGYPGDDYHGDRFKAKIAHLYKLEAYDGEL